MEKKVYIMSTSAMWVMLLMVSISVELRAVNAIEALGDTTDTTGISSVPFEDGSVPTGIDTVPTVDGSVPTVDGSVPTVDGSVSTGDGSVPTGDGSVPTVDDSVPTGDGSVSTLDGSIPMVDGSIPIVDGSIPTVDGSIPTGDGSVPTVDGSIPIVDGSNPTVDGSIPTGDGSVPTVDGSIPIVDGSIPTVDGSIPTGDGSVPTVDGSIPIVDGSIPTLDGSIPTVDGSIPIVDGSIPTVDGSIPTGDDSIPTVDGSIPMVDGSIPIVDGSIPTVDGSIPTGDGSIPTGDGSMTISDASEVVQNTLDAAGQIAGMIDTTDNTLPEDEVVCIQMLASKPSEPSELMDMDDVNKFITDSDEMSFEPLSYDLKFTVGALLPDAGICAWFKQRQYSNSPSMLAIVAGHDEQLEITVQNNRIVLKTFFCTIEFEFFFDLRQWYHLCVGFNSSSVHAYIDGELIHVAGVTECDHIDKNVLTTNGKVLVGALEEHREFFIGYVADIRFYSQKITEQIANEAREFENSTSFVKVSNLNSKSPNNYDIQSCKKKSFLKEKDSYFFFFIVGEMDKRDASIACKSFGGGLYINDANTNSSAFNYLHSISGGDVLVESWVESKNSPMCTSVTVTNSKLTFKKMTCDSTLSAFCQVPSNTKFKLIGLDSNPIDFYYIESENIFVSDYKYQIRYKFPRLELYETDTMNVISQTSNYIKMKYIMGRHMWESNGSQKNSKEMTFSACNEDEFSCDNGLCVPIRKICDFEEHCHDDSDEFYCNATQNRPGYYNKHLSGQDSLELRLDLLLNRIVDVDMNEDIIKIELNIKVFWVDQRFDFYNIHKNASTFMPKSDSTYFWQPNILLIGVANEDKNDFALGDSPGEMYVKAFSDGTSSSHDSKEVLKVKKGDAEIMHEKGSIIKLTCKLNLYIFPFDIQTCHFSMVLHGKVRQDAIWKSLEVEIGKTVTLPTFEFIHFKSEIVNDGFEIDFQLRIARLFSSQILVTFLPCILLQVIGLSVFAIPLDDLSDRLTVSISCLIVMAALFTQMSSTLPASASTKMIDIWMMYHVFSLAFVFLLQLVLHHLYLYDQNRPLQMFKDQNKKNQGWISKCLMKIQNSTFPSKMNKLSALLTVVHYVAFVTYFFLLCLSQRNEQLKDK